MGTCISKSRLKSSTPPPPLPPSKDHESCFVQDKLVIISSHPNPPQVSSPPSPSPSSSASSSFPCTNTTVTRLSTTTSCSSSASSITSCSSSSSSISVSKDKSSSSSSSYSNDYLWSCIMENPHLINQATLDKAHGIPQNLLVVPPTNFRTRNTEPSPTKSTLSSSMKKKKQSVVHPIPQKRVCSSSTTTPSSPNIVSRQKSFRRDHLQQLPNVERCRHQLIKTTSSVPASKRNSNLDAAARYSSSPLRRSKGGNNDTCKGISRINSSGNKKIWNDDNGHHEEFGIYNNTSKCNIKETTTLPVIRPSSPRPYKRNREGLGSRKKQIITSTTLTTHHIYDDDHHHHHQIDGVREEEVLSSICTTDNHQEQEYYVNSAVVSSSTDDIDNPLISLDCFIFL